MSCAFSAKPRTTASRLGVVLALLLCSSCYHYTVHLSGAAGANPSTFPQSETVHSLFWGLLQDQALTAACAEEESLSSVRVTTNFGYALLTVVTLGIWAPAQIEYRCVNPTPTHGTLGNPR